ncbi:MAG: GntR family transcriptional regulator [Aestuariivirga sp.]|jgi:DNA-binding GntR family transcriptional regulator
MLVNSNKSTPNAPSALSPLVSTTLADQVADRIVDAIIAREFVSGTRLIETELASALHVSRVPVREAIRILESQGLIVAAPHRGMQVAQFDATWAQQLHETRVAMEQVCARHVSVRLRKDEVAHEKMEICLEHIVTARKSGDWDIINVADVAFHTALFELAESPLLVTLWTAIARHVRIMFSIETYRDQDFERIVAEHQNYLSVLLKGSNAEIVDEIRSHVAGRKLFSEAKN